VAAADAPLRPAGAPPAADEHAWRVLAQAVIERLATPANPGTADPGTANPGTANPGTATADASVDAARAAFRTMLGMPVPFATIADNARLAPADAELLAVAVACELDLRLARLVGALQDEVGPSRLTLQIADRVLRDAGSGVAAAIGLEAPLRRARLVDVTEDGPWAQHAVVVHPGVIWALVGDTAVDPALPLGTVLVDDDDPADEQHAFVLVSGADRIRRRETAVHHAAASRFLVAPQPVDRSGWDALVREATLSGTGVVIELPDEVGAELTADGKRTIAQADHLAWAVTARRELPVGEMPMRSWVELEAPNHAATDEEWDAAVGPQHERIHRLSPTQLDLVGKAWLARGGDLDAAVRRLVSGRLEQLAQRMRPSRTWDDIVLSPARLEQLRSIVDRYRYASVVYDQWGFVPQPSRGLVSLFSGPSGTGKTLAAEIIAGDLGLDVFKLDLSSVVSKYIGETEKNLEQIFEAAGGSNVVLFFDEADSLFGKRSEVKDARDRYANIEVSYLLQRLERYDGVVVLATNFEKNIDEAFLRRIHTRVEFVVPAEEERLTIWARNFPPGAPLGDVDLPFLAKRFELSGGSIRNAAVHAAFLAASQGAPITMELTVRAIAREMRKLGRLLKPEHFGPWFDAAVATD